MKPEITSNASWSKIPDSKDFHNDLKTAANICETLLSDYTNQDPCLIRGVCLDVWVEVDGNRI